MSGLVSRLFSSTADHEENVPSCRVLSLRPSKEDSDVTIVHPAGFPGNAPPLYSVLTSPDKKPNVLIFRGGPGPNSAIGDARFHSLSSTTDLSLRGQPMRMKMSHLSGNFSLEYSPMGQLKWKVSKLSGSPQELCDSSGARLAQITKPGSFGSSERRLEILIPCDAFFAELVVFSVIVAKALVKRTSDVASEIGQAAAGV